MSKVTVKMIEDKMYTYTEYNATFVSKARMIGGKWDASEKAWKFDKDNAAVVRQALMDVYGSDGQTAAPTVTISIDLDEAIGNPDMVVDGCPQIKYGSLVLVERKYRDTEVYMKNGAIVAEGGFPETGGSRNHPRPEQDNGTALEVKVPKVIYEKLNKTGIYLEREDGATKEELQHEREALLARLAEIEELLK